MINEKDFYKYYIFNMPAFGVVRSDADSYKKGDFRGLYKENFEGGAVRERDAYGELEKRGE